MKNKVETAKRALRVNKVTPLDVKDDTDMDAVTAAKSAISVKEAHGSGQPAIHVMKVTPLDVKDDMDMDTLAITSSAFHGQDGGTSESKC